ncbi:MAG: hypothetical protein AAF550_04425 [Myxococcota bacterium]
MGESGSVNIERVVAGLGRRSVHLPFEIGAFIALEICDQTLDHPALVHPADVWIGSDGSIAVRGLSTPADSQGSASSIIDVLARLLVAAGGAVPPHLLRLVEPGADRPKYDLQRLRDALEATLIPLNRAASMRVLARLLREMQRSPVAHAEASSVVDEGADADLDAFLETAGVNDASALAVGSSSRPRDEEIDPFQTIRQEDFHRMNQVSRSSASVELGGSAAPSSAVVEQRELAAPCSAAVEQGGSTRPQEPLPIESERVAEPTKHALDAERADSLPRGVGGSWPRRTAAPERSQTQANRTLRDPSDLELDSFELPSRTGRWLQGSLVVCALVLFASGVILVSNQPEVLVAALAEWGVQPPPSDPEPETEQPTSAGGVLRVEVQPEGAQVLLLVGKGPAVADSLPIGVAHEFVAIAEGKVPTRALVPRDAVYEPREGALPMVELAMQAGEAEMRFLELDLGETRLTQDMGTPTGGLGRVRVVTNPIGAKVYQLVGFAPQVSVRDIPTDTSHELVIWSEGYRAQKISIDAPDWSVVSGTRQAVIEVHLEKLDTHAR